MSKRIGIIGGTFDPIHYGHLVTAESARTIFGLEKVVFVPSCHPPHKLGQRISSAEHRATMVMLATLTNQHFSMSRMELEREGYSYSYDTICAFREIYGPDTELFFITGADAVLKIAEWRQAEALLQMCTFIAATRPGYDLSGLDHLPESWRRNIRVMENPSLAISSTDIRHRAATGQNIRYLLPETVESYINKYRLYQDEATEPRLREV